MGKTGATFCISHSKDVDGIGSAALVTAARGGRFRLTSYDDFFDELDAVPKETKELVICDIGTDQTRAEEFVKRLGAQSRKRKVTYIDHHFLDEATKEKLVAAGVNLVHDTEDCASMLTYLTFRDDLPQRAREIALYGAVTDYLDTSPRARALMETTDRQFILLEATLLSYSIAKDGEDTRRVDSLVKALSKMKRPHEIGGVLDSAEAQLRKVAALEKMVASKGKKLGRVAYMETEEYSTGNVAKLLIGAFGVPVGVSFRGKDDPGWVEVSVRGTSDVREHLGKLTGELASKMGGNGGGHKLAAGCRIPRRETLAFLKALDSRA
jgi:single-stranded-DNA-specific exonuclease